MSIKTMLLRWRPQAETDELWEGKRGHRPPVAEETAKTSPGITRKTGQKPLHKGLPGPTL